MGNSSDNPFNFVKYSLTEVSCMWKLWLSWSWLSLGHFLGRTVPWAPSILLQLNQGIRCCMLSPLLLNLRYMKGSYYYNEFMQYTLDSTLCLAIFPLYYSWRWGPWALICSMFYNFLQLKLMKQCQGCRHYEGRTDLKIFHKQWTFLSIRLEVVSFISEQEWSGMLWYHLQNTWAREMKERGGKLMSRNLEERQLNPTSKHLYLTFLNISHELYMYI